MNDHNLTEIESRLRRALKDKYERANTKAELILATKYIQTALEDAFKYHLNPLEDQFPHFTDKANKVVPHQSARYDISSLNQKRNLFSHPKREFSEVEVKQTADGFAQFAVASWRDLFGSTSQPPHITSPVLGKQRPTAPAPAIPSSLPQEVGDTGPDIGEPKPKIPWRSLVTGGVLIFLISWLAGFTLQMAQGTEVAWYWPLLLGGLTLVLFVMATRRLWRFFRAVGLVRTVAGSSVLLVVATLVMIPFTSQVENDEGKVGAALDRTLASIERVAIGTIRTSFTKGSEFAKTLFAAETTEMGDEPLTTTNDVSPSASPRQGGGVMETAPLPTATIGPTATVVLQASPTVAAPIEIGMRVVVTTGGSRLNIREAPNPDATILNKVERGVVLTVVGGPVQVENITWWEVEGEGNRGWCAGQFLMPVQ